MGRGETVKPKNVIILLWVGLLAGTGGIAQGFAQPGNDGSIDASRNAETQQFIDRKKALQQLPEGPERDLQLKQEIQRHQTENKKLSLQKDTLRQETITDLKQKWSKVDTDWKNECARHDAAKQELEKLPDSPERTAKLEAENAGHRTESKKIAVDRNTVHEGVMKQANSEVAGGSKNVSSEVGQTAGTKITDPNHRGMNGDFDAGGGYRTTEKVGKILNEIGVKDSSGGRVKVKNGVLETNGDFGMTVNADPGLDRVGSSGHQAQVKTGAAHGETYVSEMGGGGAVQSQTLKDHLATLDHSKKAMHGLNEDPAALVGGSAEGQAMAKGALKAANQAGLPPETVEAIARQRGIKDPGNVLDKLAEIKTGRATITSAEEAAKLQGATRDILNASEASTKAKAAAEVQQTQSKITDLEAKGKVEEAGRLREEVADYRAKAKAAGEALTHPEEGVAGGGRKPAGSSSPTGVRGEPEPVAGGGKMMQGAGWALGLYGIYEGYQTASAEMEAKKQEEPKNADWMTRTSNGIANKSELAARTLWHGLGFGAMAEVGKKAGEDSFEQYKKDIAAGKVSADSWGSYGWMKARGVLGGLYGGAKAVTYDAAKSSGTSLGQAIGESVGAGVDARGWFNSVQNEKQTNAERSKTVYDRLIKDGASPVGAQMAADGILNGNYAEAKRLTKVLAYKKEQKDLTPKETKPDSSGPDPKAAGAGTGEAPPGWWDAASTGLQNIRESAAQGVDALKNQYKVQKEKADKEKAEKEKADAAQTASTQAAANKGSKMMAAATKAVADKLASGPALPPGAHEEVSGWAEDKNGKTRLTYIKDANGNVLGGYNTHFDPNGNETGRESFKANTASPPAKTGVAGIVGVWSGKFRNDKDTGEKDWNALTLTFGPDATVTVDGLIEYLQTWDKIGWGLVESMAKAFGDTYSFSHTYDTKKTVPFSQAGDRISVASTLFTTRTLTENSAKKGNSTKTSAVNFSLTGTLTGGVAGGTFTLEDKTFTWQATKR
jgi:hypothetical protein